MEPSKLSHSIENFIIPALSFYLWFSYHSLVNFSKKIIDKRNFSVKKQKLEDVILEQAIRQLIVQKGFFLQYMLINPRHGKRIPIHYHTKSIVWLFYHPCTWSITHPLFPKLHCH